METRRIRFFNRGYMYDNIDMLADIIPVNVPLARTYQRFNIDFFGYIDRTGSMKHFLDVIPESPVPKFIHNHRKTFFDVTMERAQGLIDSGKELYVFWSGGLDSTTVLAALYYLGIDPERVVVCMTHDSLYESGSLYDDVIKKRFHRYWLARTPTDNIFAKVPSTALCVTGNHGNLVSGFKRKYIPPHINDAKYETYFKKDFIDFFAPFLAGFPVPIITVCDFYIYHAYNFNWNGNEYFLYHNGVNRETYFNFYKHVDFENLLISTNEMKLDKSHMNDFIHFCMGDKAKYFTDRKTNRGSFLAEYRDNLFVLEDYTVVRHIDEIKTV